ncbi:sn-glycerol-1-phosphate dehydrogenase [Alkalicoccobacillus murimartini]|uniref:Glycerol-1-phosphate dehydrogenase [NAD(P)+] n=1 Tax=Alkalicoccobacillus murimartini TaxID=171685 RepID=A0ABT9YFS0_9BACI|nr:sn-glycerol-1-phosphate dehydrogenase [Alkalicoccobacillus murimartini]MDQ0206544.1 glycerol-1-phosphate dehydrogenase [NAD(P)+] [Alkalicoccobacillus murimartini]
MKLKKRLDEILTQSSFTQSTNPIVISEGALQSLVDYVTEQPIQHLLVVVDEQTLQAAGQEVGHMLTEKGIKVATHCLQPNQQGDVIADEQSIVDVLLHVQPETDCLLAVGSGTIHDVVRFVSAKTEKPFISVPTAPSVDGFNSKGAPIIVKGIKTTFQTVSPVALFADLTVLCQAPSSLVAAGFGDMIGKYTSLIDWQAGAAIANEPYDQEIADLTREALESCVEVADQIGNREKEGIETLMNALVLSGIAMAAFGASHPASGAEHHLSHYWEMHFLEEGHKQLYHGAKIGRSTLLIIQYYKEIVRASLRTEANKKSEQLISLIDSLPEVSEVEALLRKAGWHPEQAPIDEELIQLSLLKAYHLRDRWTLLRYYHETLQWVPDL